MVTVLGVLGAVAVLFGVGVVATRPTGAVLSPAEPDRPDVGLPHGAVTSDDLHRVRFGLALRGYRMSEVDEVLDRAADALAEERARTRVLEAQLGGVPALPAAPSATVDPVPLSFEKPEPYQPVLRNDEP